MATDTFWQLEREYYAISAEHDFTIRVIEYKTVTRKEENAGRTAHDVEERVASKVHEFRVQAAAIFAGSDYLSSIVAADTVDGRIDLHDDTSTSVEIWTKILHGRDINSTLSVDLKGVWDMLATANRHQINPAKHGKAWFTAWYDGNKDRKFEDYHSLLFPCHAFDHAEGFAEVTKYLAYHGRGHIQEKEPNGFTADFLRLDFVIIQQLHAARGRLKTILHRQLYHPIERLLACAECSCKDSTLFAYERALYNTGAWPLESAFLKFSVREILDSLSKFKPILLPEMCNSCEFDYDEEVTKAVGIAEGYFDGLCLDCMDASKPKFESDDKDYWMHAKVDFK